jgi:hypothetical protein
LKSKPSESKDVTDRSKTGIFGGFSSFKDFEEVKTWIQDKFWEEWLPQPAEIYYKGEFKDFKGIIFAKFDTTAERDKVVETFRRLVLKIQSEKVWSNADLPADVRIPKDFLFGLKKILGSQAWGYDLENLWVDKEKQTISLRKELILSITLEGLKMNLVYGAAWEKHIGGDLEVMKLLKDKQDLLDRPSKGDGKGKKGKVGPAGW